MCSTTTSRAPTVSRAGGSPAQSAKTGETSGRRGSTDARRQVALQEPRRPPRIEGKRRRLGPHLQRIGEVVGPVPQQRGQHRRGAAQLEEREGAEVGAGGLPHQHQSLAREVSRGADDVSHGGGVRVLRREAVAQGDDVGAGGAGEAVEAEVLHVGAAQDPPARVQVEAGRAGVGDREAAQAQGTTGPGERLVGGVVDPRAQLSHVARPRARGRVVGDCSFSRQGLFEALVERARGGEGGIRELEHPRF